LHKIEGRDEIDPDIRDHADGLVIVIAVTVLGVGSIGVITGHVAAAAGTITVVMC
jgi:hypothetical protein